MPAARTRRTHQRWSGQSLRAWAQVQRLGVQLV